MSHHGIHKDGQDLPVICPNCMARNAIGEHFCRQCGTPLTSHAEIDPMGQIYSEGDTFRKAIDHPDKPIVLIGMWLIFGFSAVFSTVAAVVLSCPPYNGIRDWKDGAALIFIIVVCAVVAIGLDSILYRVTRNYFRRRRASGKREHNKE